MPIPCPQCSYVNPDQSLFCVRCGNRLYSSSPSTSSTSLPAYGVLGSAPQTPQTSAPYVTQSFNTQIGSGQGMASIRRAFAGHGVPIMHYSWLLSGEQEKALTVRSSIMEILKIHDIPRLNINLERLVERGI